LTENTAIANTVSRCNISGNARSQRLNNNIDTKTFVSRFLKKRQQVGSAGLPAFLSVLPTLGRTFLAEKFDQREKKLTQLLKFKEHLILKSCLEKSFKRGSTFSDIGQTF
jgi:hypothetical protein